MSTPTAADRYASPAKYLSLIVIVLSLFAIASTLPIDQGVEWLEGTIDGLGLWGPVVFGLVYVLATILFIPGSALTLAAGAIFGLWIGTATVSVASVTGGALAFLIARYFARDTVAGAARKYPKFAAIEAAIRQGDWRIVFMLRLSPAIPFNLSNYLYGLTPVRFWPYVFASWVAMFPGTFMYVYLGRVGAAGLSAASGGNTTASSGRTALLLIGLVATVAVTVYVTRLARRAIAEHTDIAPSAEAERRETATDGSSGPRWSIVTSVSVLVAILLGGTAVYARQHPNALRQLFGPPQVTLSEEYAKESGTEHFDHTLLDSLVHRHVNTDGWVDYAALSKDTEPLDHYIAAIATAPFDTLTRDDKLALLINAYNAFTLRLILDYYPVESIKDIPSDKRWDDARWNMAGHIVSLNQLEHEWIRAKFNEPRIHFAINCASVGCPPLRSEAYTAATLDAQLESQAVYIHAHERWFRFDASTATVELTQLYNWYGSDFAQAAGSALAFAARYSPGLQAALDAKMPLDERFLPYDWTLNGIDNPAAQTP